MPTLIARYLCNDGSSGTSPTTLTDSSGNGHNATVSFAGNASWGTDSTGTGLFSAKPGNASFGVAFPASLTTAINGLGRVTIVMRHDNLVAPAWVDAMIISVGTSFTGTFQHSVYNTPTVSGMGGYSGETPAYTGSPTVEVSDVDLALGASANMRLLYLNNVVQANDSGVAPTPPSASTYTLGGNPTFATTAIECDLFYLEFWDSTTGFFNATERTTIYNALSSDTDTAWDDAGAGPLEFTSQPSATSITQTSVTGQATVDEGT